MAEVVLKYTAAVYQAKINAFESLNAQLMTHLQTLENLKDQIPSFWEGEQTRKFIQGISNAIVKVRQASDNVNGLKREYQETIDELARSSTAVDDVVDNLNKTIEQGIDIASTVGKLGGF